MDYIRDFCEQADCPEHPNRYSNGDDALISYNGAKLDNFTSNTIEDVVRNAAKVIVSIHGIKVPLACTICSNRKPIDMKKLMKRETAKKELTR